MTTKDDNYVENLTAAEAADKALGRSFWWGYFIGAVCVTVLLAVTYLLTGGCQ